MKILVAASEYPPGPGGLGTHAYQLAHGLARFDWNVEVLVQQDYADPLKIQEFRRLHSLPLHVYPTSSFWPRRVMTRFQTAFRVISRAKPDVVLASGDRAVEMIAAIMPAFPMPWLAVEHGRLPPPWERPLKRLSFGSASRVICVSNYSKMRLVSMGVSASRCIVVHNGADATHFRRLDGITRDRVRSTLGLGTRPVLVTVGSVTERKGQDVVIRALANLARQGVDATYLMIGRPIEQAAYSALAYQLGVSNRVRFMGPVDNQVLLELLNASDLFVLTSRHTREEFEGFGIAVVEAALSGLASVVSAESGLLEAVVPDVTALTVPEEDVQATTAAIATLLTNHERRSEMGNAARLHASAHQTWSHSASRYDRVLREVVSSRGRQ